jgi:hypothetical protein
MKEENTMLNIDTSNKPLKIGAKSSDAAKSCVSAA